MAKNPRTRYHVVPDGDEWAIRKEGSERASAKVDTKQEAIERVRELAKNQEPSQVIVHKKDGAIQTEWTYEGDPYPPRG